VSLFLALTALWVVLESASVPPATRAGTEPVWLPAAIGLGLLALTLAGLVVNNGHALGAVPLAAGIGLRVAAIRQLGARFQHGVHRPTALETRGLYRWLHHPSELGTLFIAAGTAWMLGLGPSWLFLVPLVLFRMRLEDRVLAPLRVQ